METVRGAVRRFKKISNTAFECDYYYYYYYYYLPNHQRACPAFIYVTIYSPTLPCLPSHSCCRYQGSAWSRRPRQSVQVKGVGGECPNTSADPSHTLLAKWYCPEPLQQTLALANSHLLPLGPREVGPSFIRLVRDKWASAEPC